MSRRTAGLASFLVTAFAAAALAAPSLASGAPGPDPTKPGPESRFERVPTKHVTGDGLKAFDDSPTTVMVQVAGKPVTRVEAKAGHRVSNQRRAAIRSDLRSTQRGVAARVQALGGKVGTSYQAAYNGMRVTIAGKDVAKLRAIPNVVGVHAITPKSLTNVNGVPLVGAPAAWDGVAGFHGEGMKVAIIDTGLDYTHADFAGPGTVAAFEAEDANDTDAPDPTLIGPGAPRVKGGIDLVGDDYNADTTSPSYQPVPHPDPDPLDCNGHGTHVAGTAAGSGVLANGSTFAGPYNSSTVSGNSWLVGPGVAPKADLYGVRVFGCDGSTDVVVDAIEWAVLNDMDVINMSLGSSFGGNNDPDSVATNNAVAAGVIVVTSSGNSGHAPYITGSPGTATGTISVAASDPTSGFAGANIELPGGVNLTAINANGTPVNGLTAPIKILSDGGGGISLGCDPAEYVNQNVAGTIVVTRRGTCARVARAVFGQQAGAAAVIMVNNANSLPPFEGPITGNPDTGEQYNVTIPFLGVKSGDSAALIAADGGNATLTDTVISNPGYLATASFSSGGPRSGDSTLKPDVTAPGVSISSAGVGTGNGPAIISGTSMASPHTAGAAALVRQAHPAWGQVKYWKAALVNTADPGMVTDYSTRINGSGFIQVQNAVKTQVVANGPDGTATLNFGFNETPGQLNLSRKVSLRNFGNKAVTFTVGTSNKAGSPHTVSPSVKQIRIPANGQASFTVTLKTPVATIGDSSDFRDVSGLLRLTPTAGGNSGVGLSMSYYMVPRAVSNVKVSLNTSTLKSKGAATARVTNPTGTVGGTADWYAWGTSDPAEAGLGSADVRAVGVQTYPADEVLVFGLSTHNRWSNAAGNEFDIYVDVNGDAIDDYVVVEADFGALTAGSPDGTPAVAVFDLRTGGGTIEFLADAPTDSSTMALPVLFDQLCEAGSPCVSAASPITYYAVGFGPGTVDVPTTDASFNVVEPALSTGMFNALGPFGSVNQPVTLDKARFAVTPSLGLMVMSHDNKSAVETALLAIP